ncbi:MAG: methyltransferase domain-containing protein, partial [Candidatus Omnitrophota bacterium]
MYKKIYGNYSLNMPNLLFYLKVFYLLVLKKIVPASEINSDYNHLAPTYDNYFTSLVAPHSEELVKRLEIMDGSSVLDLACGTGTLTCEIEKYSGASVNITAVDASYNMIKVAKGKVCTNVNFLCADMLKTLPMIPDNTFDFVTCGWAIGYSYPPRLLKSIKRILKNQAKVGIIENRQDTLMPLRETGIKVMKRYGRDIRYLMDLPLRLPKNKAHLEKLFIRAGLKVVDIWDGEVMFNFKDG